MRRLIYCAMMLCCLFGASCRKKIAPEFYDLQATYSILIDLHGDEAFDSDEMKALEAALLAIDANAVEGPQARKLVELIHSERRRIADAEREAEVPPERIARTAATPRPTSNDSMEALPPNEVDAGDRLSPWPGMREAEFQELFGSCFKNGGPATMTGIGDGTKYDVVDTRECQNKFAPKTGRRSYVFVKATLVGELVERVERVVTPAKALIAALDAGAPVEEEIAPYGLVR